MTTHPFLRPKDYKGLVFYQKTVCLYDITYFFTSKYLSKGDRTIDQMIQAARSGKQNIIEGTEAGMTSSETEIKLINVARASLKELLADYEDYLRVRQIPIWDNTHPRYEKMLDFCRTNNDASVIISLIHKLDDEAIANLAITLIHQTDSAIHKYLNRLESDFVSNGGLREQMTKVRLATRAQQNPLPSSNNKKQPL